MTTTPVCRNPIVAELHAIREQLAERFHNDLAAYSRAADAHCRELGFHTVPSPTAVQSHEDASHCGPLPRNHGHHKADLADL
jgi:hypothetical protein